MNHQETQQVAARDEKWVPFTERVKIISIICSSNTPLVKFIIKRAEAKGYKGKKTVDNHVVDVVVSEESDPEPARKKTSSKRRVKKKVTLSTDDNIISDDPNVSLELATRGSNKGTGTILGVPDESTVVSATTSEGTEEDQLSDEDKDDKDDDADDEGDDYISDNLYANDEDAKIEYDEDEIYKYKIRVHKDKDVDMSNAKLKDSNKGDEEVTDAAKEDAEKTLEVKDDAKKTELPPTSSSLSVSSATVTILPPPSVSITPLVPQQTTTLIPTPPITTNALTITNAVFESNELFDVQHRVAKLENDVSKLNKTDLFAEAIATLKIQVPSVVDNYLGSKVRDTMHANKSFNRNHANHRLYHALMKALIEDENAMDKEVSNTVEEYKRNHDDDEDDDDEDPPAGPNQGKSAFAKELVDEPTVEVVMKDTGEDVAVLDEPEQTWFNQMVSTTKDPLTFNDLMATPIDFSKYVLNRLKIDNLTQFQLTSPRVKSVSVKKLHEYGNLEEIMVKRADHQFYKFKEGNFMDLHLNDIEDMLLLAIQHKLFHLTNNDIIDFIVDLRMFTRSLVIKKHLVPSRLDNSVVPYGYACFTEKGPGHLGLSFPGKSFNLELKRNSWHKTLYKINHKKVRSDPEEYFSNHRIVEVFRVTTEQQHGLDFLEQINVMRENDKLDSFSEADFTIETTEEGTKILATIDDAELFENLTLMGYNISLNQKFTFQKGQFSHQWKYLIHTIMQSCSPKSTRFNEFSSNITTVLVCLATNRVYNFSKMIFDGMVKNVNNKVSKFLMYPRFLSICLSMSQFGQTTHTHTYGVPFHTRKLFTTLRVNNPSFSGRIVPLFDTMLVSQGEGSGTPTEPHHTPFPEAQQTLPTTSSSPTLPPVTTVNIPPVILTAPLPTVVPTDIPQLRHYTRRARIAQSSALPPVADEPASPLRDVSQGEACPTVSSIDAEQDRANIAKTSTLPSDSTPRVTSLAADKGTQGLEINSLNGRIKALEDKDSGIAEQSGDDALIKGRRLDEGEEAAKKGSNDTEGMINVLTSMDAATVLSSRVVEVPIGSGSIPTADLPATGVPTGSDVVPTADPPATEVPTGSDVVPTASLIFATATVVTPYTRRKGKEKMIESETPKKKKIQEQMDIQIATKLKEEMERDA
nr:hypothetical protein [Tanacetum cinerariifolium]